MKLRLFYLLLLSFFNFNQLKIKVLSSFHPDEKILYAGVENKIRVEAMDDTSTRIIPSHGELYKQGRNEYVIRVYSSQPDTLRIYQGKRSVATDIFQVKSIPHVVARLAYSNDSIASVTQILANPFLTTDLPSCNYRHQYSIFSFSLKIIGSNSNGVVLDASGDILTDEQKAVVKKLKVGNQLLFFNIKATCPDCAIRLLREFRIYIG